MTDTIRDHLFSHIKGSGCTNGDCIVRENKGMVTNGSCSCLHNMSRSQLHILKSSISRIIDRELKDPQPPGD